MSAVFSRWMAAFFCLPAAALLAVGCVPRLLTFRTDEPAQVLQHPGAATILDGRLRFREIVCELAAQRTAGGESSGNCETLLWRLEDEQKTSLPPPALSARDTRLRILLVPGAFSECFPEYGMPFEDAARGLERFGYRFGFIPVSGRGGPDYNALQIASAVANLEPGPGERIVLIGHSKGVVDILHFLVNHPEPAGLVAAVVSVAGAVNGSPLADEFRGLYDWLFSKPAFKHCPPADREVVDSLQPARCRTWLASHPLPNRTAYFSLVTFTRRQDTYPLLLFGHDLLSSCDPRNDGFLLWYDQVIPGSTLLGYVALDHYDVALPVRERLDMGGRGSRAADREIILQAILLSIAEALD